MQFSLWPDAGRSPADTLELARWADANRWFGVWYADHYMRNTGDTSIEPGDVHECWAVLPAIAAVTSTVRIGPLVSPTSVHHPAVLANRAASLDHLSNGRFVLGIGAGWQINEHAAYGIELEAPGRRVTRFDEAIQIIRSLLTEPRTSFAGSVYRITDAPAEPKPVQSPLPILVGTGSPRMLGIAARWADEWNTWGTPEAAAPKRAAFVAAAERVGRDPEGVHTSVNAMIDLGGHPAPPGRPVLTGSPDHIADQIGRLAELGFDEFVLPDWSLGNTNPERLDVLERIQSEVFEQV